MPIAKQKFKHEKKSLILYLTDLDHSLPLVFPYFPNNLVLCHTPVIRIRKHMWLVCNDNENAVVTRVVLFLVKEVNYTQIFARCQLTPSWAAWTSKVFIRIQEVILKKSKLFNSSDFQFSSNEWKKAESTRNRVKFPLTSCATELRSEFHL